MQTVRQGDTLWSYWRAVGADGEPVDLTGSTVAVHVVRQDIPGQPPVTLVGEVADGPQGRFRHQYNTLAPGVYFLEAQFSGPAGIGTAPTEQNALLRVVHQIA